MRKTEDVLLELGITPDLHGFQYICEILKIIDTDNRIKMMDAYRIVGERYNSTGARVERAVRHAIEKIVKAQSTAYQKYVGLPKDDITNKSFLYTLKYKMKAEDEENGENR